MTEISYIIPVLDAEKTIIQCLRSIYSQNSEASFEVIIVDNGCRDKTISLVQEQFSETKIESALPKSPAEARNVGIKSSMGKYLAFIDADIILDTNWSNHTLEALEKSSFDIAQGINFPKGDKNSLLTKLRVERLRKNTDSTNNYLTCAKAGIPIINTAATMIRASVIKKGQVFFDTSLKRCEDTDLSFQLIYQGCHFLAVNEAKSTVLYDGSLKDYFLRSFRVGRSFYYIEKKWTPKNSTLKQVAKRNLRSFKNLFLRDSFLVGAIDLVQCMGILFEAIFNFYKKIDPPTIKIGHKLKNLKFLSLKYIDKVYVVAPWVSVTALDKEVIFINFRDSEKEILTDKSLDIYRWLENSSEINDNLEHHNKVLSLLDKQILVAI